MLAAMRRRPYLLMPAVLAVALALFAAWPRGQQPVVRATGGGATGTGTGGAVVTVLFDTHMHGNLTGMNDVTMAHYIGLIKQRRAERPNSLWLGAGDDLGSSLFSSVYKGAQMVEAYNGGGLDADTIGNHEFDYGPDNFVERVRESRFTWVSANVRDRRTGSVFGAEAGARLYVIREVAGVRVGITGAAWNFLSSTNAGPNVEVLDAATGLAEVVPQMRRDGAQLVIVLAHMCVEQDRAIATAVPSIDAIVGDHCAERARQPETVGKTVIARRGDEFQSLGELTLRVEDGRLASWTYQDWDITKELPRDDATAALIAGYRTRLDAALTEVLGSTTVTLDARTATVRGRESNLGNYLADAMRAWGSADVAIQNGGGIRGAKEFPAGPLSRGDIASILPFNNTGALLRLPGSALHAALENGVSQVESGGGRFPQVSGLTFSFNPSAPAGLRVLSVTVGGQPLDPARMYTLATNDFLANGGDGYTMFKDAETIIAGQAGPLLTDLLASAVQRDGTIAPMLEGRITMGQ